MKLVALTSAAVLAASTAFAGTFTTEVTEEVIPQPEASAPSSLGWIIPVVAVAAIAAVVLGNDDDDD